MKHTKPDIFLRREDRKSTDASARAVDILHSSSGFHSINAVDSRRPADSDEGVQGSGLMVISVPGSK